MPRRTASVSFVEEDVDKSPLKLNLVETPVGWMIEIFELEIPRGWTLGWTLEPVPPGRVLCVPCMRSTRTFGWLAGVQLLFCKGAWQRLQAVVVDIILRFLIKS